jgi:predicted dienelactone hydrolase
MTAGRLAILLLLSTASILWPWTSPAQSESPVLTPGNSATERQGRLRELIRHRFKDPLKLRRQETNQTLSRAEKLRIADLEVAVWRPDFRGKRVPLVIFSHGCHGFNTQTTFLMKALAGAGYLVMAPNHKDAATSLRNAFKKPAVKFIDAEKWSDRTFIDRHDDLVKLIDALRKDPQWKEKIDWSELALAGHSLGGYTVLACGGAWPSWKIPGVKAILALSPYTNPFLLGNNLAKMGVPVMYQGGTLDLAITPFIKNQDGAFEKTGSPVYFVEFERAGHFFWSDLNMDKTRQSLINHYSLAFFNRYVRNDKTANLKEKLAGVSLLESK